MGVYVPQQVEASPLTRVGDVLTVLTNNAMAFTAHELWRACKQHYNHSLAAFCDDLEQLARTGFIERGIVSLPDGQGAIIYSLAATEVPEEFRYPHGKVQQHPLAQEEQEIE